MIKNIGYSSLVDAEKGTINHWKLAREFDVEGIKIEYFGLFDDGHIELTFDDALESKVNEIISKHDPTPLPDNSVIFSVKKVADVISKAASNIAFYAKNAVGGGCSTRYSNITDNGNCEILEDGTYFISLDFRCNDAGENTAFEVSILNNETEIVSNHFDVHDQAAIGQLTAIVSLHKDDCIISRVKSDKSGCYRISADTTLTICPV